MMTVGDIRKAIEDLPDDAPVFPVWKDGPPDDNEPGVEVFGFEPYKDCDGTSGVAIKVGLFYLEEQGGIEDEVV